MNNQQMPRVGGRVDLKRAQRALGFEPEVGETFLIDGIKLRVLARTIGIEADEEGQDQWFDMLFVATVDPVADLKATAQRIRAAFGLPEEAEGDDDGTFALSAGSEDAADGADGTDAVEAEAESRNNDRDEADADDDAIQHEVERLDAGIVSDIEDILRAA